MAHEIALSAALYAGFVALAVHLAFQVHLASCAHRARRVAALICTAETTLNLMMLCAACQRQASRA